VVVFATVTSTTWANTAYWTEACKEIPFEATFLMLDLGTVLVF
jgi:hypothetical protein